MANLIEMVCTGNLGRSPVAELVANNALAVSGEDARYTAVSSGTVMADAKKGDMRPYPMMASIVKLGVDREDVYNNHELENLRKAFSDENPVALLPYFVRARDMFVREEEDNRKIVLPEFGLDPDKVKTTRDPLVAGADRVAVLGMDLKHIPKIKEVYQSTGFNPLIKTVGELANGVEGAEIGNALGRGRDFYRQVVAQIIEEVPRAVQKIVYSK